MKETTPQTERTQDSQFNTWWKKHWKKVVVGGVFIASTIVAVKNWGDVKDLLEQLFGGTGPELIENHSLIQETIQAPTREISDEVIRKAPESPFDVSAHIRNLPEGQHASLKKIAEAEALNIILLPNQTLVDAYVKGERIA